MASQRITADTLLKKQRGNKMMDRLNFRVWYKPENKYLDGIFAVARSGRLIIDLNILQDYDDKSSDCIIEQCTGLKDKNGNLIYEGDIVHEVDKEADIDDVSQIVWNQCTCHFMKLDLPETGLDRHCILCEDDSPYIEIIGNIHESNKLWIHYELKQKDVK